MTWEDSDALAARLNRSLDAFNWKEAEEICQHIVGRIKTDSELLPETLAEQLLKSLRRKRRFMLVTQVAEALLQSGLRTPLVWRHYAQALTDQGFLAAAETLLGASLGQADIDPRELAEAHGLLGRIYKQTYINHSSKSQQNRGNLERAVKEYLDSYRLNPQQNLWHGINVVALLFRAQRDNQPLSKEWPKPEALAHEILKESESAGALQAWDLAIRMEAYVALGRYQEAVNTALLYIACHDADAFELRSTIRQFSDVWQLNDQEPPASYLLAILKAGHLRKEGATAGGDFESFVEEANAATEAVKDWSAIGGEDKASPLKWYKMALDRCRSIATVETVSGKALGTGWLVKASDFFPQMSGVLLLTNEHVISRRHEPSPAVRPEEAQANFPFGGIFKFKEIIWSNPRQNLDATFVSIEGEPKVAPLQLDSKSTFYPSSRLYIISQSSGEVVASSLGAIDGTPKVRVQDTCLLAQSDTVLHYRTPEEVIGSGSPVFEPDDWLVVALHHASAKVMPRLDGREGTYDASEGISIAAIQRATQARFVEGDQGSNAYEAITIGAEGSSVDAPQSGASKSAEASFRITLEGEAARQKSVQYGTNVDLVFEYVPPPEVDSTFSVERTRKLQVPLGILVVPVGFKFKEPTESGYRNVRFNQGAGNEKVRFELRASRHPLDTDTVEDHPSPECGFHIIFDLRGSIVRQLFFPARLVKELPELKGEADESELHSFDLASLKQFDDHTVQAQQRVAVALQKVLS